MKPIIGARPPSAARVTRPPAPVAAPPAVAMLAVDDESAGQRLDNFLLRHLKGVPKTHVYRIIRSGEVRVNAGRAAADTRIASGDRIRVPPLRLPAASTPDPAAASTAPPRDFAVLLEDEHVLAIDKPAGTAVHGGSGVAFGVIEQMRRARPEAKFLELVHRLDRETSGVLLLAKKRSALTRLQDQFRERETDKVYLALVAGGWPASRKVIDSPLHKYLVGGASGEEGAGERRVKVVAKDHPDGMHAVTLVKVVRAIAISAGAGDPVDFSLLEVTIKTGRTHQIRVHLASEGHPIAGDDKYGDFELNRRLAGAGLGRMFLHAWKLTFTHPGTGKRIALESSLPAALSGIIGGA